MATVDAPTPTPINDADGNYLRWRWCTNTSFGVADLVRFPCPHKLYTLTLLEIADPANPAVTTFQPQLGYAPAFVLASFDGRTQSPTADAPSRSQVPVALELRDGYLYLRPVPSGVCASGIQISLTLREGHRA